MPYKPHDINSVRDVRNLLWDSWVYLLDMKDAITVLEKSKNPLKTFFDLGRELCPEDVNDTMVEGGVRMFTFEQKYFLRAPQYTMEYMFQNYNSDIFLCGRHQFFLRLTFDDFSKGHTPICPYCNLDSLKKYNGLSRYVEDSGGEVVEKKVVSFMIRAKNLEKTRWKNLQNEIRSLMFFQDLRDTCSYIVELMRKKIKA